MKKITQFLFVSVVMLFTTIAFSQSTLTGTVMDSDLNSPLPGANVVVRGTTNGTTTDFDGNFTLTAQSTSGSIVISYVGYGSVTLTFTASANLGTIYLSPDNSLDEVVITGTGIIDLAKDRQTPVAVSTVKAAEIAIKGGNQEFPELLKSTPSVYTTKSGGGFGDARINVRGFDQSNTAFLINGQPINGMEDGKMYWSNWQGVTDVANAIQVQRGLGSSKLAISSVGGTVNIVTKTVDKRAGGFVQMMTANDNYLKTTAYASTGLSEKGWAFSALLGHWQGDGYNQEMYGTGQTYFFSVGYVPNENHTFNFLVTGAPQNHNQRNRYTIEQLLEKGLKYNDQWGQLNGDRIAAGSGNYYHKPIANLSWDWTINDNSNLSTVVYASYGRGGSIGLRNYSSDVGDYFDLDAQVAYNRSIAPNSNGLIVGERRANGRRADIIRSSVNEHRWYGVVSNFNYKLSETLSFNIGFDGRSYHGEHYRRVVNFLGLDGWDDDTTNQQLGNDYVVTESYSANAWKATFHDTPRDQRIAYDNPEDIRYLGGFGQLEYAGDKLSAFVQGAVSTQSNQRFDYFNYAVGNEKSEKVTNSGFNVKAGANYNLNDYHNVFVNVGHYSRQPYQDNMFLNFRNDVNPFLTNEKITGFEAGYGFRGSIFAANVNLYHTTWDDRVVSGSLSSGDGFYQFQGVKQVHSGLEVDFTLRPTSELMFKGFTSIGNWEYDGNASQTVYDDNQNVVAEGDPLYLDGVKVGDAAQFTVGLGGRYEFLKGLSVDADYLTYDNLYASFVPTDSEFSTPNNRGSVKLPSYSLVDAGVTYDWKINTSYNLVLRLNVNNAFDEEYISESLTNRHVESGDATYKGVSVRNQAYFGYGRTWNFSMRLKF